MVKTLHAAGIEVILDVVYNHTARATSWARRCRFRGIDNATLLPLDPRTRATTSTTPAAATRSTAAPARAAAGDGLAALLGAGDARRRLPLRPRLHAGARGCERRRTGRLLRHHPPGSRALAGEAHRRALGRRARAATRSATSRPAGPSGTTSYRDTVRALLEGRRRPARRVRAPPHGLGRPVRGEPAGRRTPASTSSPRTTASRCTTSCQLQREAQRGQRRGQPRRQRQQPLLELRRRGARPTIPRSTRCARARSATSSPRCCFRRACRCCWRATSSAARRAATTTPTARTTRSAGSTGRPAPTRRAAPTSCARCCACGASIRLSPPRFPVRQRAGRRRRQGHAVAASRRPAR